MPSAALPRLWRLAIARDAPEQTVEAITALSSAQQSQVLLEAARAGARRCLRWFTDAVPAAAIPPQAASAFLAAGARELCSGLPDRWREWRDEFLLCLGPLVPRADPLTPTDCAHVFAVCAFGTLACSGWVDWPAHQQARIVDWLQDPAHQAARYTWILRGQRAWPTGQLSDHQALLHYAGASGLDLVHTLLRTAPPTLLAWEGRVAEHSQGAAHPLHWWAVAWNIAGRESDLDPTLRAWLVEEGNARMDAFLAQDKLALLSTPTWPAVRCWLERLASLRSYPMAFDQTHIPGPTGERLTRLLDRLLSTWDLLRTRDQDVNRAAVLRSLDDLWSSCCAPAMQQMEPNDAVLDAFAPHAERAVAALAAAGVYQGVERMQRHAIARRMHALPPGEVGAVRPRL